MCTNLFLLLLLLLFTLPWEVIFLEIAIINIYNWHIQIVDGNTLLLTYTKYSSPIFDKILTYTIVINNFPTSQKNNMATSLAWKYRSYIKHGGKLVYKYCRRQTC